MTALIFCKDKALSGTSISDDYEVEGKWEEIVDLGILQSQTYIHTYIHTEFFVYVA